MEDFSVPTLQFSACLKIALLFWTQRDVEERIVDFPFQETILEGGDRKWKLFRDSVAAKVGKCPVPDLIQTEIVRVVSAVAWQIQAYARHDMVFGRISLEELRWTPRGVLDKRRSIQAFVENEQHSLKVRLQAACCHCLEDHVVRLSRNNSSKIYSLMSHSGLPFLHDKMMSYWIQEMDPRKKVLFFEELESDCYNISIRFCYEVPFRYFWKRRESTTGNGNLVKMGEIITREHRYSEGYLRRPVVPIATNMVCSLLSQMNHQEKMEFFRRRPLQILLCFLNWPAQQHFVSILNQMWEFLSAENCLDIFWMIEDRVLYGYDDYNYRVLLDACLGALPSSKRLTIIDMCVQGGHRNKFSHMVCSRQTK